jgi:hypothetical protein
MICRKINKMAWKSLLVIGAVAIVAVAIVYRVAFLRNLVIGAPAAA